jgi:hypothetical protein
VAGHLAGDEVAHDDPAGDAVLDDEVEHLGAGVQLDRPRLHLVHHLLVGPQQQLLAGLATGVERAAHLGATEGPVVQQAAVLPGEGHPLRHHLVDDVHRHLGEPVHVRLAGAEVASLDRVVEEALHRVAVALVVLGGVDPALGRDRVGPPRAVVVREDLDVVALLAERGGGAGAGQAAADDDHVELPAVVRCHELHVELVLRPPVGQRALGDVAVQAADHWAPSCSYWVQLTITSPRMTQSGLSSASTMPVSTEIGNITFMAVIKAASPIANERRHEFHLGLFNPRLWNMDQVPWNRWMPNATLATM